MHFLKSIKHRRIFFRLMAALGFFFASTFNTAVNASVEKRESRKLERVFREVIQCTHGLISENTIEKPEGATLTGVEAIPGLIGAGWLQAGLEAIGNSDRKQMTEILSECAELRKGGVSGSAKEQEWIRKLSNTSDEFNQDARILLEKYSSSQVAPVMNDFLAGMSQGVRGVCRGLGVQVTGAFVFGAGAGIRGVWCRTRDGQQWLELIPSITHNIGAGFGILGDFGFARDISIRTRNLPKKWKVDDQGHVFFGGGPAISVDDGDLDTVAIGVGVGVIWEYPSHDFHFRVIQLPMRVKEISRRLQSDRDQKSARRLL